MSVIWKPHPGMQTDACMRWEYEVFMGGAAGPGKTDVVGVEATRDVGEPDYRALIVRRTYTQLEEVIDRTRKYYPVLGGEYRSGDHRWHFPSGAAIKLGHCQNDGDEYNYQGKEFQYLGIDEAGQFIPKQILYLHSRVRGTNPRINKRVRMGANPGGPAHQFLKDRFQIGQYPEGYRTIIDPITGLSRVFIPGRLADNPSLTQNDPGYVQRLMQLPEIERLRLMEGIWDAFEGQGFPELNAEIHGFEFDPPPEWERIGAFDWGYAKPYAYGLFAIDYEGRMYLYKMLYGAKKGEEPNKGVRQTDSEIARAIKAFEKDEPKIRMRVAGHDIFSRKPRKDGTVGPAPIEAFQAEGIHFIKADNDRIQGWQQLHHRLMVDEEGRPTLYVHKKNCPDWWRTMQNMAEDPSHPEDMLEKNVEDHPPEMTRYGVMTRPIRPKHQTPSDVGSFQHARRQFLKAKQIAGRYGISLEKAYGRM